MAAPVTGEKRHIDAIQSASEDVVRGSAPWGFDGAPLRFRATQLVESNWNSVLVQGIERGFNWLMSSLFNAQSSGLLSSNTSSICA